MMQNSKNNIDIVLEPIIQNEISLNYPNLNTKEFRRKHDADDSANVEYVKEWIKKMQTSKI